MRTSHKKKSSSANKRLRERSSKLSFLFVIFFFGLFSLIIVMESLMTDGNKHILKDENEVVSADGENEEYSNWDISYEEMPSGVYSAKPNSEPAKTKVETKFSRQKTLNYNEGGGSGGRRNEAPQQGKVTHIQSDWQKVAGTKEKFYVYSAYYNSYFEHIRIIGVTRTKSQQQIFCRFYDNRSKAYAVANATIRTIRENWNLRFSACFIICNIPKKKMPPKYVSVITTSSISGRASNLLGIKVSGISGYPEESKTESIVDFSACVKPIHFNYDGILTFLEWIEFHKMMGVTRFIFYNHTIGHGVGCVMKNYGDEIEIQVLPWSLPFVSQKEIRTEGLFAALNDCVYRARGSSKYLVLVDLDEMIVPRKSKNYTMLLDKLYTLSNKKKVGVWSFQNAFFYLQWPDDQSTFKIDGNPMAEKVSKKLLSLRKSRRRSRLHPHKQRSKYICDPEKVVEAGNHFVWEMALGYYSLSVPPHLASLHHYRVCEFGGNECVKSAFVVDRSAHYFGQELAVNVAVKLEELSKKCNLDVDKMLDPLKTTPVSKEPVTQEQSSKKYFAF